MIDYKKLQEAMEFLFILRGKESRHVSLRSTFSASHMCIYQITIAENDVPGLYRGEHELIEKLKELIQPEPRYKEGDTVYFYVDYEQQIYSFEIAYIINDENGVCYTDSNDEFCVSENRAFLSREALIESQITYWLNMLEKPEQIKYFSKQAKPTTYGEDVQKKDDLSHLPKCKKCGGKSVNENTMIGGNPRCSHDYEEQSTGEEQRVDEIEKCVHEHDGNIYTSNPPQNKCRKCGEFYR